MLRSNAKSAQHEVSDQLSGGDPVQVDDLLTTAS
jgi:hypothetical protein